MKGVNLPYSDYHLSALLRLVIGLKNSYHFLDQSEAKQKPIVFPLNSFSPVLHWLHVFAPSFDWFNGVSVSFVIGQSDYLGFGSGHSNIAPYEDKT